LRAAVLLNLKSHLLGEGGGRRLLMHRPDKIVILRQTAIFPAGQLQRILQWARRRTIPVPHGPHIVTQVFISQHADYNSRMGIGPEKRITGTGFSGVATFRHDLLGLSGRDPFAMNKNESLRGILTIG
jgi:hypothetical protein